MAHKQIHVIYVFNYNDMFACVNEIINVDKIRFFDANTYLFKLLRRDSQFIKFFVNPKL